MRQRLELCPVVRSGQHPDHQARAGVRARAEIIWCITRGRVGGRKPRLTPEQAALAQQLYDARDKTVAQIAALFAVPRSTVYGHLTISSQTLAAHATPAPAKLGASRPVDQAASPSTPLTPTPPHQARRWKPSDRSLRPRSRACSLPVRRSTRSQSPANNPATTGIKLDAQWLAAAPARLNGRSCSIATQTLRPGLAIPPLPLVGPRPDRHHHRRRPDHPHPLATRQLTQTRPQRPQHRDLGAATIPHPLNVRDRHAVMRPTARPVLMATTPSLKPLPPAEGPAAARRPPGPASGHRAARGCRERRQSWLTSAARSWSHSR